MQPIREEEEDALTRLETRLEAITSVIRRLREQNAELESRLRDSLEERDRAMAEAEEARQHAARLVEESEGLRGRQREAAARIKSLLSHMEQMDLGGER